MKQKFILVSFIISTSIINAMTPENVQKHEFLPHDIHRNLIYFAANYPPAKKPKEAIDIIINLAQTSTKINAMINEPRFTHELINNLAWKYHCSHETIAKMLTITNQPRKLLTQPKKQLALQYKLKRLCCSPKDNNLYSRLCRIVAQGAKLEFTYNHFDNQKTPLMIAMSYNNNMFGYLLSFGANINGCNSHGITPLHLAVTKPINLYYLKRLILAPDIAINQQNRRGENALLYCITHWKQVPTSLILQTAVGKLLKAGIDPECCSKGKKGSTPFNMACNLGYGSIARLIYEHVD